jgi:hypothetical protein
MFLDLPNELIIEILSYLESYRDMISMGQVNTTFRLLVRVSIQRITTLGYPQCRFIPSQKILEWPHLRQVTVPILMNQRSELEMILNQTNLTQMNLLMSHKLMEQENSVDYSFYAFLLRLLRTFLINHRHQPFHLNLQWHPAGHHILTHDLSYTCSALVHQDNTFMIELDHLIGWIHGHGIQQLTIQHHLFPPPIQLLKDLTDLTVYLSGNRYGLNETLLAAMSLSSLRQIHLLFPSSIDVYSKLINLTRLIGDLRTHLQTGLIPYHFELEVFDVPIAFNQVMVFHQRFPRVTQFTVFLEDVMDLDRNVLITIPETIALRVMVLHDIALTDLLKHSQIQYDYI